MKEVKSCIVENCVPTQATCIQWNGGDIEYLGICNGAFLHNIIWEIVGKLKAVAGEDLSAFDMDSLLALCGSTSVGDSSLLHILTVLKNNQICLKDFIDKLSETVNGLSQERKVSVNLKCFQDYDNVGNALQITRDELDQLVINQLCSNSQRLDSIEGKIITIQAQIDNLDNTTVVDELSIATCIDAAVKPTSSQVQSVATALCNLQTATGTPANIATLLASVPSDWNTKYASLVGWKSTITNEADLIFNMMLVIKNHETRVDFMETNCCAASCDDVKLGFAVSFVDSGNTLLIKFSAGAGTSIPAGFTDKGSTGSITDKNGNVEPFTCTISNNGEVEVSLLGLDTNGDLNVNISAKMGNDSLVCEKCLNKTVKPAKTCAMCEIVNAGSTGTVTIIYDETI